MTHTISAWPRRLASPWAFVLFVFVWTWGFWFVDVITGIGTTTTGGLTIALCGLLGPMIGGIGFTYVTRDRAWRRDYWVRFANPRRFPARWYLVIFLLVPALMAVSAAVDLLTGGSSAAYREAAASMLAEPGAVPVLLLTVLLFGPLPEEFGWHGYLLDRLQERHRRLVASLRLGTIWGVWHLPLFFMPGTYQYEQGAFTVWFWTFMIGLVPLSVVMAWLFNGTNRSTLAIVLFHFMVVVTCNFLNVTPGANIVSTILWIMVAGGVTFSSIWKGEGISTRPRSMDPVGK